VIAFNMRMPTNTTVRPKPNTFVVARSDIRGPRIIATDRQAPLIYPRMIPLCSRFDSVLFTPKMSAIASYGNYSRSPDVNDDAAISAMTKQVIAKFGRIDILINAAATVIPQDFFKMDDAHLTSLLDQKFNAAARCIRHVVPHMRKNKWGRIINASGLAGRQPHFTVVPAALNNSAMLNLTKALATELAKDNILINAVVPYIIDTERQTETMQEWAQMTGQPEAEVRQQRISKVAVRRMGRSDEVSAVVVFMVSERASYVVGTAWYVDGGGAMTL